MDRLSRKARGSFDLDASPGDFFGTAPGALKNHLNTVELSRITLTAMMAGGGILGLLQAVQLSVGTIFPAPTDAALAALILTLILESLRRLGHGQDLESVGAPRLHLSRGSDGPGYRI